ncbi:MAG: metalloregulator ArsR/SmtB family transcription factor [Desulfoplanes sp.]
MSPTSNTKCFHPEAISKAHACMPDSDQIKRVASLFATLGDPTRLGLLLALQKGELCVCDLSSILTMTMSAISHQLRILRHQGLITSRKEGRMVMYQLADDHVQRLLALAVEHGTICAPKLSRGEK